jgi:inorganic pyrophosphatase
VRNDRLLAVPVRDERSAVESALDLPARVRGELEQFFLHSIFFEPKNPRILGWAGPDEAEQLLGAAERGVAAPRARRPSAAAGGRGSTPGK